MDLSNVNLEKNMSTNVYMRNLNLTCSLNLLRGQGTLGEGINTQLTLELFGQEETFCSCLSININYMAHIFGFCVIQYLMYVCYSIINIILLHLFFLESFFKTL